MKYVVFLSLFLGFGNNCLIGQDLNQRYYYDGSLWQDFRKVIPFNDTSFLVATQSWEAADLGAYQTQVGVVNTKGELLLQSTVIINILQNFMTIGDIGFDANGDVLVGGSILSNNMMVRIADGAVTWSKVLSGGLLNNTNNDFFQETSPNNYVIAGHRAQGDFGFITKLDETALTDTFVRIYAPDVLSELKSLEVIPSSKGGYYVITNFDRTDLVTFYDTYFNVLRLDDDLNVLWNRSYSVLSEDDFSEIYGFLETEIGFVATGRHNDGVTFLEFDSLGNNFNSKKYIIGSNEQAGWGSCIISDNNGGYFITTGVPSPSSSIDYQSLLMNIDATGNVLWVKRYNPDRSASFKGIRWHEDNLVAYGRVVENDVNLAFWLSTAVGYEDCNYEEITSITQASNTFVVDNPRPTVIDSLLPKQGTDAFLSTRVNSSPLDSSCAYVNDVVFPGDANYDQVANIYDILPIGVYYNSTGSERPNATLDWSGQWSEDWNKIQASTADIKHIDCDGNGTVDAGDVIALDQNYGLTHNSTERLTTEFSRIDGPELYVDLPENAPVAIEFASNVIFGSEENPAEDVYGVSFVVDYSSSPIALADISFEPNPSWFGTSDSVISISKHLVSDKRLEIGIVKTTGQNQRRGIGTIGQVYVVTEDNVLDRIVTNEIILDIIDVKAISVDETILPVDPQSRETIVTGYKDELLNDYFEVYPNPAQSFVTIKIKGSNSVNLEQVSIFNGAGKLISTSTNQQRIDVDHLASGIYWIKIESKEGVGYYMLAKE